MGKQIVTASTITPFLLAEAKEHLRESGNENDGYIQSLILAVTQCAEKLTRRALFTQTWKLFLDEFPAGNCAIELPLPPLQSITHVKYYDTAGTLTTMAVADYQTDLVSLPGRLAPAPSLLWPSVEMDRMNAVEVQFVCGVATRGALDPMLRQAMLQFLSHLYDNREPAVVGTIISKMPYGMRTLFTPFQVKTYY